MGQVQVPEDANAKVVQQTGLSLHKPISLFLLINPAERLDALDELVNLYIRTTLSLNSLPLTNDFALTIIFFVTTLTNFTNFGSCRPYTKIELTWVVLSR